MGSQLKWTLVALVVGALAAGGFGVAVALRGNGGEGEALHKEADHVPEEGFGFFFEAPEVEELPLPRSLGERPFVGVTLAEADEGVEIKSVTAGSPAEEAGLKKGDLIRAIDGEEMDSVEAVTDRASDAEPGDELTFTVERDGEQQDIDVVLAERSFFEAAPGRLRERLGDFDWGDLWPGDLGEDTPWFGLGRDVLDEALTRFLDAQGRFLDEEGETVTVRAVAGTVKAVETDALTVALNGGGEEKFAVSDDTRIRKDLRRAELSDLKADDRVLVIVVGEGDEAAAVVAFSPREES